MLKRLVLGVAKLSPLSRTEEEHYDKTKTIYNSYLANLL